MGWFYNQGSGKQNEKHLNNFITFVIYLFTIRVQKCLHQMKRVAAIRTDTLILVMNAILVFINFDKIHSYFQINILQ